MFQICSIFNISQPQFWTMEEKDNSEQIQLKSADWPMNKAFLDILGIVAPTALIIFILGHSATLLDFLLNIEHSKSKTPSYSFHRLLSALLLWPFYGFNNRSQNKTHSFTPRQIWKDGSILCTQINSIVPGACKDPRQHWRKRPEHGMKLVLEYLDIQPIFSSNELTQDHLTPYQEQKLSKYLNEVNALVSNYLQEYNNMRFSTDYVARGMGLVIGEQNRKSTFYIYPVPKHNHQPADLEVTIKGPLGNNGKIIIPSILHYQQKWQQPTEYKRAMYMSSKLNSMSPTTQGTSFLRKLSLTPQEPNLEIDIRVKISSTRAKVSYVPQRCGIYEVRMETRGSQVVGSPYTVPVELATSSTSLCNDSSGESDEDEGRYIKRKKRIISKIVDFMDEKKSLNNDAILIKLNSNSQRSENELKNSSAINEKIDNKDSPTTDSEDLILETNNNDIDDIRNDIGSESKDLFGTRQENVHNHKLIPKLAEELQYKNDIEKNNNKVISEPPEPNKNVPDILETPNLKNSPPFEPSNDQEILNSIESYSVDPTLLEKVLDTTTNHKKLFSNKDPTKESIIWENNTDINFNKSYIVNNLIGMFDNIQDMRETAENGPDLVKCHIKKPGVSNKLFLREKLRKIGAISETFDKHQCYLKDCLKLNFEQYIINKQNKIVQGQNNMKLGIVDRQKHFWDQKLSYKNINYEKTTTHKVILNNKLIFDNKCSSVEQPSNSKCLKPLEGIVGNKIQMFENKSASSSNLNIDKYGIIKKEIQKSRSESFLPTSDNYKIYPVQRATSIEGIIKIPTVQERKNKLLQACQQNYSPTKSTSIEKIEPITSNENQCAFIKIKSDMSPKNIQKSIKPEKKHSIRRKARFKRAKLFFHHLEGSDLKQETSRSESDSSVSYQSSISCSTKPKKITERFPVDDLFQDILGDDKGFFGIPNKTAVMKSLASLESSSSRADFDSEVDEEPDLDNFEGKPTRKGKNKVIPGFLGEYPYIPTTDTWRFKSRSDDQTNELIPGRVILTQSEGDMHVT